MPPQKARRPAPADAGREPHGSSKAGELGRSEATFTDLACLAVYDGTRCIGFLMPRGKSGVEAFDADDRSLGLFPNEKAAADAISARAS